MIAHFFVLNVCYCLMVIIFKYTCMPADVLSFVEAYVLSFSVVVERLSLQYYRAKTICSCEKNSSQMSFLLI